MNDYTEEQLKERAKRRVDFKYHFFVYIVVIAFLWAIWAVTGGGYMWPVWPAVGWGIGILFHYVGVFNLFNFFSVEKEIEKLKKEKGKHSFGEGI